jgi:hypothetical protein
MAPNSRGRVPGTTKPLDLPPAVTRAFMADMKAFHAEKNAIVRDEIAARQMAALRRYQGRREKPLRLTDIRQMFEEMRNQP